MIGPLYPIRTVVDTPLRDYLTQSYSLTSITTFSIASSVAGSPPSVTTISTLALPIYATLGQLPYLFGARHELTAASQITSVASNPPQIWREVYQLAATQLRSLQLYPQPYYPLTIPKLLRCIAAVQKEHGSSELIYTDLTSLGGEAGYVFATPGGESRGILPAWDTTERTEAVEAIFEDMLDELDMRLTIVSTLFTVTTGDEEGSAEASTEFSGDTLPWTFVNTMFRDLSVLGAWNVTRDADPMLIAEPLEHTITVSHAVFDKYWPAPASWSFTQQEYINPQQVCAVLYGQVYPPWGAASDQVLPNEGLFWLHDQRDWIHWLSMPMSPVQIATINGRADIVPACLPVYQEFLPSKTLNIVLISKPGLVPLAYTRTTAVTLTDTIFVPNPTFSFAHSALTQTNSWLRSATYVFFDVAQPTEAMLDAWWIGDTDGYQTVYTNQEYEAPEPAYGSNGIDVTNVWETNVASSLAELQILCNSLTTFGVTLCGTFDSSMPTSFTAQLATMVRSFYGLSL